MNDSAAIAPQSDAAQVSAQVAAIIPLQHHDEFHKRTTDEDKERIALLLRYFDDMAAAPEGVVSAATRLSLEHHGARGWGAKNLLALYYRFINSERDWRVLVRQYRGPDSLPQEFRDYVKTQVEKNARGARQALLDIKSRWSAGEPIPGYGTWREFYLTEFPDRDVPERYPLGLYPRGWSLSNLYTKQSSKAERTLKRRGFAAAKRYLPHVMRDMSGLRPMELIVIDDFETDIIVLARHPETARQELCTCTGLLAIDGATRRRLALGLKPRFKNEEGRRLAITRADVQQLLYSVFSTHGLPQAYGVTMLAENAAAAISGDFELVLETLLGVQVARTGLIHDKTLKNGFLQGGGKPWEKGWIESTFNLMHNMAATMPGQKGASYQLKPADLEAKLLYAEKLLNIEGLTPEQQDQVKVAFLPFDQALEGYERIFDLMDLRTQHKLQGFEERTEFMLPDGSGIVPETALVTLPREQIVQCQPVARMETPLERWNRLSAENARVKISEHALALLLLTPKKVELRNHKITFASGAQGFTFADADSPLMRLPEGTEVLGYFDGAKASVLHCTDLSGRYLGSVKRRGAIDIRDRAAISAEAGEITRLITKHVLNPVRARHEAENAQLAADVVHNRALLTEAGVDTAKILPPAGDAAPRSHSNGPRADDKGILNPATPATARRPVASLSAKLGRTAPARDAFTAYQDALAAGIAAEGQRAQVREERAIELRGDEAKITAEDIAAATAPAPQAPKAKEFSPEEISDLLSD